MSLSKEHLQRFVSYYTEKLQEGLNEHCDIDSIVTGQSLVASALQNGRRIFAFGNGGSYAIASSFLLDLKEQVSPSLRREITSPLGLHELLRISHTVGYENVYAELLRIDGRRQDIAILVSSSGISQNIVSAAMQAKRMGITVIAVTNKSSEIEEYADLNLCVPVNDQQPGEDIALILLRAMVRGCVAELDGSGESSDRKLCKELLKTWISGVESEVVSFVGSMNLEWLLSACIYMAEVYFRGGSIFVYAPQGGIQGLTASHVAHNLQWDALMDVDADAGRRICVHVADTDNVAHLTGVSNDRRGDLFHARQILFEGDKGDIALAFGSDVKCQAVQYLLAAVEKRQVMCYAVVMGDSMPESPLIRPLNSTRVFTAPWAYECGLQVLGHLLGRVLRVAILDRMAAEGKVSPINDYDSLLRTQLAELMNREPGTRKILMQLGF